MLKCWSIHEAQHRRVRPGRAEVVREVWVTRFIWQLHQEGSLETLNTAYGVTLWPEGCQWSARSVSAEMTESNQFFLCNSLSYLRNGETLLTAKLALLMTLYSDTSPSHALSQHENTVSLFNSTAEQKHKMQIILRRKKSLNINNDNMKPSQ